MRSDSKYLKEEAEALRIKGGLDFLQLADPSIENVIIRATFVSVYVLNEIDQKWARADLEGPLYIVSRSVFPQLVIVNQRDPRNLVEDITPLWEVSSETNYLFFRVPLNSTVETHPIDPKDRRVAGLWFSDDTERQSVQNTLEHLLATKLSTFFNENVDQTENLCGMDPSGSLQDCKKKLSKLIWDKPVLMKAKPSENKNQQIATKSSISEPEGKIAGKAILTLIGANRSLQSSQKKPYNQLSTTFWTQDVDKLNQNSSDNKKNSERQEIPFSNAKEDNHLNPKSPVTCSVQCPHVSSWSHHSNCEDIGLLKDFCQESNTTVTSNVPEQLQLPSQRTFHTAYSTQGNEKKKKKTNAVLSAQATRCKSPAPSKHVKINFSKTPIVPLSQMLPRDLDSPCDFSVNQCSTCLFHSLQRVVSDCQLAPRCSSVGSHHHHHYHCCCCFSRLKPRENLCLFQCCTSPSSLSQPHPLKETSCSDMQAVEHETCSYYGSSESFLTELDQRLLLTLLARLIKPSSSCKSFTQPVSQPQFRFNSSACQCSPCQSCSSCCTKFINNFHSLQCKPDTQDEY